jgi:hypothetical protein
MIEPNFQAIGKIPDEYIFVHKNDIALLERDLTSDKIKCIAIDMETKRCSYPVVINRLLLVCPHDPVISGKERKEINEKVKTILSGKKINKLNNLFEKIKSKDQSN